MICLANPMLSKMPLRSDRLEWLRIPVVSGSAGRYSAVDDQLQGRKRSVSDADVGPVSGSGAASDPSRVMLWN